MSSALGSGNISLKSPYVRSGLVLGLGGGPETVFIFYLRVSSKMPDRVVLPNELQWDWHGQCFENVKKQQKLP